MTLGAKITAQRNKLALTQQELADKLQVPLEQLTYWERNLRDPNTQQCQALAELFQMELEELRSDDDGSPIFLDHPEEAPQVNRKLCMRYTLIFGILGLVCALSLCILGFITLTPALLCLGIAIFFFWKGNPEMSVLKKLACSLALLLLAGLIAVAGFYLVMTVLFTG